MRENLQADCVQSRRRSLRDAAQGRGENKQFTALSPLPKQHAEYHRTQKRKWSPKKQNGRA